MHPSNYGQIRSSTRPEEIDKEPGPHLLVSNEDVMNHSHTSTSNMSTNDRKLQEEDSQYCESHDRRRRSGSWNGAQESDEEIECRINTMARNSRCSIQSSVQNMDNLSNSFQNFSCNMDGCQGPEAARMRRKLRFFFMDPMEKWKAKRRAPWKLLVQILKILIATSQLCMFASQRFNHVSYLSDTKVAFSHLFLPKWDDAREVNAYPPSMGPLAFYRRDEMYQSIDFAVDTFVRIKHDPIGSYQYEIDNSTVKMPRICFSHYKNATISPQNWTFTLDRHIIEECIAVPSAVFKNDTKFSSKEYLEASGHPIDFLTFLELNVLFEFRTVKLVVGWPFDGPECYLLKYNIRLDNSRQNGQMLVLPEVKADVLECKGTVNSVDENSSFDYVRNGLNILTIIISFLSLVMCVRSIYRARKLRQITGDFFMSQFNMSLTFEETFKFINLWYVLICINDAMLITGSLIKVELEREDYEGYLDRWNACSVFLGVGNALVWFGCLRYLSFFQTYNVMILTLKHCFHNVIRYSFCILLIFFGFSFSGWLILSPYHLKFRSLASTVECLFSLMNGDDMYATFAMLEGQDSLIWWFSRFYLYSFIGLFISVILSLFIAIIMDSYETIKKYYEKGFPKCRVLTFAHSGPKQFDSDDYLEDQEDSIYDLIHKLCCCMRLCRRRNDYEPLPS